MKIAQVLLGEILYRVARSELCWLSRFFLMQSIRQRAIGSAACCFAIVCTLVLFQHFQSETWLQNISEAKLRDSSVRPMRYDGESGNGHQRQSNESSADVQPATQVIRDPMVQPAGHQADVVRYPLFAERAQRPEAVPTPAVTPSVSATNSQFDNRSLSATLSPEDQATLKSLPPACTSDIESLIRASQAQPPAPQQTTTAGVPMGRGSQQQWVPPVSSTTQQRVPNQFNNVDLERYNPHAKATQVSWESDSVAKKKSVDASKASGSAKKSDEQKTDSDADPHLELYSRDAFPSARECKICHEQIYEEWASSSHAYASISPMFHVFENKVNKLTSGTMGYFCLRCHAPVATTMGLRRDQPIWDGPAVFKEGVTCIACHRVKTPFTKTDGERRIEPGGIYDPVYGGSDGGGVATVAKYKDKYKVKIDPHDKSTGQKMHRRSIQFEELSESTFCMSCHQVAVKPGIKLEVVWDQYRASPACREGVSCQDCHMGVVPGVDAGYSFGPAAVVGGKVVNPERKHSNHVFYGPGYSIAHPGIFPQNTDGDKWTVNQWLEFDWRSDWGKEKFEDDLADGLIQAWFPPAWQDADTRVEAREVVEDNLKKLNYKKDLRRQLLENGSKLDGPFFASPPVAGKPLNFRYCLTNTNPGHNMPSGSLGAQPQLWMNVVLIGPNGNRLWETGHVDSNGDLADNHSLDVLNRTLPFDDQLFNLQTKFLTQNVKGTDREMYLPVNFDVDQLPFIRPAAQPVTVLNHPPGIRMEGHSLPALASRNAKFSIPAKLITQPGTYRLSVRMRSRAEPIYFMRFCDATPEMERMMNEWIADFHVNTVTFNVR